MIVVVFFRFNMTAGILVFSDSDREGRNKLPNRSTNPCSDAEAARWSRAKGSYVPSSNKNVAFDLIFFFSFFLFCHRGPSPISCFKGQWKGKMKSDLLNLKTMEESLDWLIKDCAQQLFALTDLTENAKYPHMPVEQQESSR